jgi:hypothetical protein
MARLPVPGQDNAQWGTLLNEFLLTELYDDGTLHYSFAIQSAYDLPVDGVPRSDLATQVLRSLNRADAAVTTDEVDIDDLVVTVKKNGTIIGQHKAINFIPSASMNVVATDQAPYQASVAIEDSYSGGGGPALVTQVDGSATTQRPVIDFEGGPNVVDDAANVRTRIFVPREYLSVTDPRIGVALNSPGTNQGPKLQAALDLAGQSQAEACVFLPAGVIYFESELVMPDTRSVRLLGSGNSDYAGAGPSGLLMTTDRGDGKYALKLSSAYPWRVENIAISGPGAGIPMGQMPAAMNGIYCPGPGIMKNVSVGGFGSGIGVIGTGQAWHSCMFSGNGYGMNWLDNPSGEIGGHLIERCFFTSCSRAGIAIADSATMKNTRFLGNGHFGTEAFGIYRYANGNGSAKRPEAMLNVVFENYSFEGCGNGIFYDEPGDGLWKNIVFDSPGESSTFGWTPWPGKPQYAVFDVGYAENWHWRANDILPNPTAAHPHIYAHKIMNIRLDGDGMATNLLLRPGARPFVLKPGANPDTDCDGISFGGAMRESGGQSGSARVASEAISRYDLVEMVGHGQVRVSRNNATSQIAGVACDDYAAGEICFFYNKGYNYLTRCKNQSGVAIDQGTMVKPDPNHPGCVMQATGFDDKPIIGRAVEAGFANGSANPVMVML